MLTANVSIGYDVPWRQVDAMLIAAAQRTPGVRTLPAPRVYQTSLGDFYVAYRLVCESVATAPAARAEASSALYAAILDVFNEHGVQIMSPHYLSDPATPKIVPPADWYAAPAQPPPDSTPRAVTAASTRNASLAFRGAHRSTRAAVRRGTAGMDKSARGARTISEQSRFHRYA